MNFKFSSLKFAKNLGDFVKKETKDNTQFRVWTSLMTQTVETGKYINGIIEHWKALNEIDAVRFFTFICFICLHCEVMVTAINCMTIKSIFKKMLIIHLPCLPYTLEVL